jgi:hypothetical protein
MDGGLHGTLSDDDRMQSTWRAWTIAVRFSQSHRLRLRPSMIHVRYHCTVCFSLLQAPKFSVQKPPENSTKNLPDTETSSPNMHTSIIAFAGMLLISHSLAVPIAVNKAEPFEVIKRVEAEPFEVIKRAEAEPFEVIKRAEAEPFEVIKREGDDAFEQIKRAEAEPFEVIKRTEAEPFEVIKRKGDDAFEQIKRAEAEPFEVI